VAGTAGELVTTLADLDRFCTALLRGDLLPPRQLREMLDTRTAHGSYGMDLSPEKLPCGTTVWGHNGRITGSYVRTAATPIGPSPPHLPREHERDRRPRPRTRPARRRVLPRTP
jgi:D-alanyl-D-alanine carboxypeptidase